MERVSEVAEGVKKVALGEGSEEPTGGASQALKHPKADKKSKKAAVSATAGPLEVHNMFPFREEFFLDRANFCPLAGTSSRVYFT